MSEDNIVAPVTGTAKVGDLIPYDNNPRIHSDDAIDRMIESIRSFGFRIPVLVKFVDEHPEVIDGHLRLKAAQKMGLESVPILDASDMTEEQVRAFRIMVNRSVSWAEWDEDKLLEEMKLITDSELSDEQSLAALTGFDDVELNALMMDDAIPENLEDEWGGMPEYATEVVPAFRSITMHFNDQNAVDAFAKAIGQTITDKTVVRWFPEKEQVQYHDAKYEGEA